MVQERLSVLALFGTRPEVIKLAPVIDRLAATIASASASSRTSQHREMIDEPARAVLDPPDFDLNVIRPDQTPRRHLDAHARRTRSDPASATGRTCAGPGRHDLGVHRRAGRVLPRGSRSATSRPGCARFDKRASLSRGDQPAPDLDRLASCTSRRRTTQASTTCAAKGSTRDRIFVTGNTVIDALREVHGRNGARRSTAPAAARPRPGGASCSSPPTGARASRATWPSCATACASSSTAYPDLLVRLSRAPQPERAAHGAADPRRPRAHPSARSATL